MQNQDPNFSITNNYQPTQTDPTLHSFDLSEKGSDPMAATPSKLPLMLAGLAIVAGILTGFGGAKLGNKTISGSPGEPLQQVATGTVSAGEVFGVQDEATFKDSAEGYLEEGGAENEGSHKLLRAGGESQTVYLTSSVTDLSKFKGMQVKVWGETNKGQNVGWLMDVGRVQVINPAAEAPVEQ